MMLDTPNTAGYVFCAIWCILNLFLAFQFVDDRGFSTIDISDLKSSIFSDNSTDTKNDANTNSSNEDGPSQKSKYPLKFDHCKMVDSIIPLICGDIPLKGYKKEDCIVSFMSSTQDFQQVCMKMKKGKEYNLGLD